MRIGYLLCSDAFVLSTKYLSASLDLCLCDVAKVKMYAFLHEKCLLFYCEAAFM